MDQILISNRRSEIAAERERLTALLEALAIEEGELDITEKTLARLSGAKASTAKMADAPKKRRRKMVSARSSAKPTSRQLILEALMDARQKGCEGLAPRHIREYVEKTYGRDIGTSANTVASRMWRHNKEINKDTETGLFSLPEKNEPTDDLLSRAPSAGSYPNQPSAQGREADVPGGGP